MAAREHSTYLSSRRERLTLLGLCIDCAKNPKKKSARRCIECANKINDSAKKYKSKRIKTEHGGGGFGITFEEIGRRIGVSRSQAENIFFRAIEKITKECNRRGIVPFSFPRAGRDYEESDVNEDWRALENLELPMFSLPYLLSSKLSNKEIDSGEWD